MSLEVFSLDDNPSQPQKSDPQITDLRSGVRDPNRINVFVDGKFSFSLDVAQIVDLGVKKGQKISAERLAELKQASEFGKLYQRTLEWVLTRPHSEREVRDYLRRRQIKRRESNWQRAKNSERKEKMRTEGVRFQKTLPGQKFKFDPSKLPTRQLPEIPDNLVELVIERLVKRGYIDDQKFANYYVENRSVNKGISQKKMRLELVKKGISADIIDNALTSDIRSDADELQKIIAKKRSRYSDEQKLIAYLLRQGFNYDEIILALSETD